MKEKQLTIINTREKGLDLLSKLEEHTVYLVTVQWRETNPPHKAILFVGFKNGAYCEVYNNTYNTPESFSRLYSISIESKLCKLD